MRLRDKIEDNFGIGTEYINELKGKNLTVKSVLNHDAVTLEEGLGFAWCIDMLEPVSLTVEHFEKAKTPEEIVAEMEEEVIEVEEIVEDTKEALAKKQTEIDCLKAQIEVYESIIDRFFEKI